MTKSHKWTKCGVRQFKRNTSDFNAVIFGSSSKQMWAWAVWGVTGSAEGIECSLASARRKANAEIERQAQEGESE